MSTKILFLDVDGVLCTRRSHLAYGKEGGIWHDWDPLGVDVIRKVCLAGVRMVLSSTWRKPNNIDDFHKQAAKYGLHESFFYYPDWKAPIMGGIRGDEIQDWLNRHPEITNYKIIDDDAIFLPHQEAHWIKTDMDDGMSGENIKKLLNWAGALKS